jgi:hypothetical protein
MSSAEDPYSTINRFIQVIDNSLNNEHVFTIERDDTGRKASGILPLPEHVYCDDTLRNNGLKDFNVTSRLQKVEAYARTIGETMVRGLVIWGENGLTKDTFVLPTDTDMIQYTATVSRDRSRNVIPTTGYISQQLKRVETAILNVAFNSDVHGND